MTTVSLCVGLSTERDETMEAGLKTIPFQDSNIECANVRRRTDCSFILLWYNETIAECDGGVCVVTSPGMGRTMSIDTYTDFQSYGCYREIANCVCITGKLKSLCDSYDPCASLPVIEKEDGVTKSPDFDYKCDNSGIVVYIDNAEPGALENRTLEYRAYLKITSSGEINVEPVETQNSKDSVGGAVVLGEVTLIQSYTPYCDSTKEDVCGMKRTPEQGEVLPCNYTVFADDNGLSKSAATTKDAFCAGHGGRHLLRSRCCVDRYYR